MNGTEDGTGPLGRVLRPPDRRLLMGYGPAVVIAAAFLLMAFLVPTVSEDGVLGRPVHDRLQD